jgi:hypothetical protein
MLIGTAGIGAVIARSSDVGLVHVGMGNVGTGISLKEPDQTGDQDTDQTGDSVKNQTRDQTSDQVQNQSCEQDLDQLQNQTHLNETATLQELLRKKTQEQDRERANLSVDHLPVLNQYMDANAFVYTLQNQSEQFGAIGPQISQYAMQINNSLQNEIQAQEALQTRHLFVRALFGGDETAARQLEQEAVQNQLSIRDMNQLIEQSACDPQVQAWLQDQLQQMQQQQIQLQRLAQKELQDKGLIGWMWKK